MHLLRKNCVVSVFHHYAVLQVVELMLHHAGLSLPVAVLCLSPPYPSLIRLNSVGYL